jgi:hypothetical protein
MSKSDALRRIELNRLFRVGSMDMCSLFKNVVIMRLLRYSPFATKANRIIQFVRRLKLSSSQFTRLGWFHVASPKN